MNGKTDLEWANGFCFTFTMKQPIKRAKILSGAKDRTGSNCAWIPELQVSM
jgi:hypothetical protein